MKDDGLALVVIGIICLGLIVMHTLSTRWFLMERINVEMMLGGRNDRK